MPEKENFVDIMDKKNVPLSPEETREIERNPRNLTKEGCQKKIELWNKSNNKYVQRKFKLMLQYCKEFSESGKVKVKRTNANTNKMEEREELIFQRDVKDKPVWVGILGEDPWIEK